jgi:hypothetical protein
MQPLDTITIVSAQPCQKRSKIISVTKYMSQNNSNDIDQQLWQETLILEVFKDIASYVDKMTTETLPNSCANSRYYY